MAVSGVDGINRVQVGALLAKLQGEQSNSKGFSNERRHLWGPRQARLEIWEAYLDEASWMEIQKQTLQAWKRVL